MKKCIYTLKTEPDATFIKREHIFPKSIGGVYTLERGMVSDQANELFSPLEKSFVQNTPTIQVTRGLMGPQGRKKHDKKDSIIVMQQDDGNFCLGYLDLGKPIVINQFICTVKERTKSLVEILSMKLILNPLGINSTNYKVKATEFILDFKELIQKVKSKKKRIQFRIEKTKNDTILVGIFKDNLFIGISDLNFDSQNFLESLNSVLSKGVVEDRDDLQKNKSQVICTIQSDFNVDIYRRVIGKIAFNCLAKLYGQKLVLQECFNPFRKMLLEGINIGEFFHERKPEALKDNGFFNLFIKGTEHAVIFYQCNHYLYAMIYFYGSLSLFNVLLTTELPSNYSIEINGYFCDWKAHSEYTLMDVIKKLVDEPY